MTFEPSNQESNIKAPSFVSLSDLGEGVYSIQIKAPDNNALSEVLIEQLQKAVSEVQNKPSVKSLILKGTSASFLTGDRTSYNRAIEHNLFKSIVSIPFPVIAAMQGDATGAGFLLGALCDFMICSTSGNYYYTNLEDGIFPSMSEYQLFEERFGKVLATDFLYASESSNGNQLKEKGWTCPILAADQVEAYAQQLATDLIAKSEESLRLLKQHLSNHILKKTENLSLVDPLNSDNNPSLVKQQVTSPAKYIELRGHGNVLVITMCVEGREYGIKALVADLKNIFNQINNTSQCKSIVLASGHADFIPGTEAEVTINDVLDLQNLILDSSIPVVAVLNSNTNGIAWFVSLFCDACVYNAEANYSAKKVFQSTELSRQAGIIFLKHFGNYSGEEILMTAKEFSGLELQQITATTKVFTNDQTMNAAIQLGSYWAKFPLGTLMKWKKESAIDIREKIKTLPAWSELKEESGELLPASPSLISLKSKVIAATAHPEGILVVKMEDREAKNMFSEAFIEGLNEVFEHVEKSESYKVVVMIGYDNYFASGGTKENLLDIQEGKSRFTDNRIYQIAMTSKIPVIAAMQGHGIGGGWNLGMFADLVLFSEESKYFSPYMNYGFTPGAGATFIYPEKIGYDLTRETLLTAQEYSGKELKERGLVMPVVPREQIYKAAMDIAKSIATGSRSNLIALKHQFTQHLFTPLEETYKLELAMHEKTFVGQTEALKQIEDNFNQKHTSQNIQLSVSEINVPHELPGLAPDMNNNTLSSISASVKNILANELHMQEHDIDENTQFVDLGLDSITGVTFIRKINEIYRTRIDAIKVYSYPTLTKLSRFVKEEVEKVGSLSAKPEIHSPTAKIVETKPQINLLATSVSEASATLTEITAVVKKLLVEELHMPEHGIDDNTQFIDLGLDSITGVTLVRKINDRFKTKIDAIKVYSYPTLTKLSRFVKEEIEKKGILPGKTEQTLTVPVARNTHIQQKVDLVNTELSQTLDTLPEVTASIKKLLSGELHLSEHEIDENAQFVDLGLDSITGVTFVRKINEKYNLRIDAIKVYSYPTITKLSRFVKEEAEKKGSLSDRPVVNKTATPVNISTDEKSIEAPKIAPRKLVSWRSNKPALRVNSKDRSPSNGFQPIAVIGMAGQFPMANNLEEFWKNISQGKNCISEIPSKRWDIDKYYQKGEAKAGKTNSKWSGVLEEYDLFDPLFFNISPTEAELMDPQQRVFLQACWHAIENAGYNPQKLSGSKCGVFVGCGQGDYRLLSNNLPISAMGFTGNDTSILAGRVSYFLNLQGPSLSIETACSSSLVAIANACDSLISGNSDLALAGGVYIMTGPEVHIKCAQMGMLSQDGKCHTFDQNANGFVPGEGVGVVMLKRLADAERDRDMILGVIQGWGVNQDGKTNGITAPNSESQTRLEQDVYDKFQIDPEQIQLIEAHGTGTKLGDPIEVDALKQAFNKYTQKKEYCALGSVKSNIGHCLTAAGVASFIKVIQALNHKQLPPTIHYNNLNEHISLRDSPFYVNDRLLDWKVGNAEKRQAAISAFGFSGTNAHIVLAEYLSPVMNSSNSNGSQIENVIVPLSARNEEQLKQKAIDLLDFIQKSQSPDLSNIAYTLQVGREEMEVRLGFVVTSLSELAQKLKAYISNNNAAGTYHGKVIGNKAGIRTIIQDESTKEALVEKSIAQKNLTELLSLWTKGLEFDWNKLYGNKKPQRIAVPVYPFAKERYWIESSERPSVSTKEVMKFALHPLLHTNTSNFREQSYTSIFTGDELFLNDHKVNGQKILPGVAYLEMTRAAIENAMPFKSKSSVLELENIVWLQPILVDKDKEVTIALVANDMNSGQQEHIDFEVYTKAGDQDVLHCQGQAVFINATTSGKIEISHLKRQMQRGSLEPGIIYETFTRMGFTYGPAHQGITHIDIGEKQILANLHLPTVVEADQNEYHLHPSLMDSALQSSIGLMTDLKEGLNKPILPFALDSLRIISACTTEMIAWVRYSSGSSPDDKVMKLDIDLCDPEGNICIQMKGFKSRVLENDINSDKHNKSESIINYQELSIADKNPFDDSYYQKVIEGILNNEVSIDEAVNLG